MGIQLNHISGLALAMLAAAVIAPAAHAQDTAPETIPEALDNLGTTYSGDYFRNRGITRQAKRIFGLDFPERAIEWDANATSAAVRDILLLQNTSDPTIRVPDLANPYSSSLLTMPSSSAPYVGSEFIFEQL
ncbi:hypothetical protein IQ273_02785 [Nodosilinea sp. LEGE 07298]|uniref:hypothetical protein n=1 Tax=Nodosilinea sp. LEGE 07298 TaxID=2777970 RepID=UPI00187F0354|nr:hypothetical protein [Nodosilinea sp. LEGE 07298]MBE9108348.1 hypothetical protein [Nodosilinea sp. LEGE 07298]